MRSIQAAFFFASLLAAGAAHADATPAQTVADDAELRQSELTEDEVSRYVGSLDDMQKAMGDLSADAAQPDATMMAKLEVVAKKHGFRGFEDYNNVAGNISLVVDGIDPDSKTYVGAEKLIQRAIEEVKADAKLTEADKTTAVTDLEAQLKVVAPIKFKSNIDLVLKHYSQINGG